MQQDQRVEEVVPGEQEDQQDHTEDTRPGQRDDDMAQGLRPRRAVDAGGLDQALVEALKRRDEQHHVEAKVLPDDHDQHRQHRRVGRGQQMRRLGAKTVPDRGDKPIVAVIDEAEDQTGRDLGQDIGHEKQHAQRHRATKAFREYQGQRERKRQLDRERNSDDEPIVAQREPEGACLQHEAVIVEANPVGRPAEPVPVEGRVPGGLADWQHHEQREQ